MEVFPTIAFITDNVSSDAKTSTVADRVSDTSSVAGDSTTKGVKSDVTDGVSSLSVSVADQTSTTGITATDCWWSFFYWFCCS